MTHMPHLQGTMQRWAKPSTLLLMAFAIAYWGPGVFDRHFRDRPWISAVLSVERSEQGAAPILIRDLVEAQALVAGERLIWIEDSHGVRICGSHREDSWEGRSARTWSAQAFFDHACTIPEDEPWHACTRFVVSTEWGSRDAFGPYCSELFDPTSEADG